MEIKSLSHFFPPPKNTKER